MWVLFLKYSTLDIFLLLDFNRWSSFSGQDMTVHLLARSVLSPTSSRELQHWPASTWTHLDRFSAASQPALLDNILSNPGLSMKPYLIVSCLPKHQKFSRNKWNNGLPLTGLRWYWDPGARVAVRLCSLLHRCSVLFKAAFEVHVNLSTFSQNGRRL